MVERRSRGAEGSFGRAGRDDEDVDEGNKARLNAMKDCFSFEIG